MFSYIANSHGITCISAGGKGNILSKIKELPDKKLLVFADGAAFGSNMAEVYQYTQLHPNDIILYLPESFEWLVLASGVIHDSEIDSILAQPADHIECRNFFSWEQYFTHLLTKKTAGSQAQYSKRRLNNYYLNEQNVVKIIHAMESDNTN